MSWEEGTVSDFHYSIKINERFFFYNKKERICLSLQDAALFSVSFLFFYFLPHYKNRKLIK